MDVCDAIYTRCSIRRYQEKPISEEAIFQLIQAAGRAPSAKNRQPWFFYIIRDKKVKKTLVETLNQGIDTLYERYCKAAIPRPDILNAKNSVRIMEQAAAVILIKHVQRYDTYYDDGVDWPLHALDIEVADLLSVGAAVQNMLLAAEELHIGTLWVCDIFYAYPELTRFLGDSAPILSAICLGYPDETPDPRMRFPLEEISTVLCEKGANQ